MSLYLLSALFCVTFILKELSKYQKRGIPTDLGLCGPYVHKHKAESLCPKSHVKTFQQDFIHFFMCLNFEIFKARREGNEEFIMMHAQYYVLIMVFTITTLDIKFFKEKKTKKQISRALTLQILADVAKLHFCSNLFCSQSISFPASYLYYITSIILV